MWARPRWCAPLPRQPEPASRQMATWAAYLRGQADVLHVPILDTTAVTLDSVVQLLAAHVADLERVAAS